MKTKAVAGKIAVSVKSDCTIDRVHIHDSAVVVEIQSQIVAHASRPLQDRNGIIVALAADHGLAARSDSSRRMQRGSWNKSPRISTRIAHAGPRCYCSRRKSLRRYWACTLGRCRTRALERWPIVR